MTIQDAIREFINRSLSERELYSKVCTVSDVNESTRTCTCTPVDGTAVINDVRLQSSLSSSNGFVQIPKDGSKVIATFINKVQAFVSLCEEVDKIIIDTDLIEINSDLVEFNGGTNDGMVKINDLVSRLNNLENDINTLKTAFSTWVVVPTDGGAALKTISAAWYGASLTPTVKGDIENTKITQ